jgi:hypothetical protein
MTVHWIVPMVLGIYVGVLIAPFLRAWGASKDWEREARGEAPSRWSARSKTVGRRAWPPDADLNDRGMLEGEWPPDGDIDHHERLGNERPPDGDLDRELLGDRLFPDGA